MFGRDAGFSGFAKKIQGAGVGLLLEMNVKFGHTDTLPRSEAKGAACEFRNFVVSRVLQGFRS